MDSPRDAASELKKLLGLSEAFALAAGKAFDENKRTMTDLGKVFTAEEKAYLSKLSFRLQALEYCGESSVKMSMTLQAHEILISGMSRLDAQLVQSSVPAEMATPEVADLFKKHGLPVQEKLARQAIKPPAP